MAEDGRISKHMQDQEKIRPNASFCWTTHSKGNGLNPSLGWSPCALITSLRSHFIFLLQWKLTFNTIFGGDIQPIAMLSIAPKKTAEVRIQPEQDRHQ